MTAPGRNPRYRRFAATGAGRASASEIARARVMEHAMTDSNSRNALLYLSLALNVATLGCVFWYGSRVEQFAAATEESTTVGELADEIADARIALGRATDRIEATVLRLADRSATPGAAETDARADRPLAEMTEDELFLRWQHVCDVLSRHRHDPMQREPVEDERGRVEAEMRSRKDGTIATIATRFRTVDDHWLRTRLLTHLVEPIATERAYEFALAVFDDPTFGAGIRLYAAQVAMQQPSSRDRVIGDLVDLLRHPDASFDRPADIVNFLKVSPDPRALPVLIDLARAESTEQNLRTYAIEALGSYHAPECVTALQELAQLVTLGNLRVEAVRSLHKIQGKEILEFLRTLRESIGVEDQNLRIFLDNIEMKYQNG
jgi:hypothetical protein